MVVVTTLSDGAAPRATMKEVATLAGVSLKTVSRVVNGEPHVSDALVARVQQAARQLDYRPDLTARSLRHSSRATQIFGLVLESVSNPFASGLLRAIEDAAREHDVAVLAVSADEDPAQERELVGMLLSRQVDALLNASAAGDQSYLARDLSLGKPVVYLDRPPSNLDADTVSSTNSEGSADAVRHLIARGHRQIAFLGDVLTIPTAVERLDGYRSAVAEARLPLQHHVVSDMHSSDLAEAAVRAMLLGREAPTALFTAQNLITVGALRALHSLGMASRVALIGFDELDLADLLQPPVAVVAQDVAAIGQRAAQLAFDRLHGTRSGPGEHFRIPTQFRARASAHIPGPG